MDPQSFTYRSPLYSKLQHLDATFAGINDYAVALTIGDPSAQAESVSQLSLCDLSGLPRIGVKGSEAGHWLAGQGFEVPGESNRSTRQSGGALLSRLSASEFLVLGDIDPENGQVTELTRALAAADEPQSAVQRFVLPRQHSHCWLRITGRQSAPMLAKLCAVDLRTSSFDPLQVAQTSVARLNAIVIRDDIADVPAYHLLADSASAWYWWDCLLDAGSEYGMSVVGLDALRDFRRS
jgi:sarcosine oxidase subunit gamma